MISAIFEILGLLAISCLIGIYFTYRFWKAKWIDSQEQNTQIGQKLTQKEADLVRSENEKGKIQQQVEALEAELVQTKEEAIEKENKAKKAARLADPNKRLEDEVDRLRERMGEKEREIAFLFNELAAKKISYYKQIDGKRYKAITIKEADAAVSGKGDGRISKEDAKKIFDTISDGKAYTQVEKDTMHYLRDNYNWTDSADELFRKKVRSWAAKHHELD